MKSKRISKRFSRTSRAIAPCCERLESRQLLDATLTAAIPPELAHPAAASTDNLDLSQFFNDPNILGTVVTMQTTQGPITVTLTDNATPITVQNFLSYVNSGAYNNTFFHRSAVLATNAGGSPTAPADIVQGGGYFVTSDNGISHVSTNAAIQDEYTQRLFGNIPGTIAMAKTSDANSATSEFFFNVNDNTGALDTATQDSTGTSTSYTVFGKVLGNGMTAVDALAALSTVDISQGTGVSALTTVPITGDPNGSITANSLEYINSAAVVPAFTYTVTSDNPSVVQPSVSGSTLSFTYGAGTGGVANITIKAASADGSTSVTQSFALTVPNAAAPSQGPTASNDVAPDFLHDTTSTIVPLVNDTDSLAALLPSSVIVTTPPTNGTATVDPTTGDINYIPNAGFIGTDSLQYTVSDANGSVSNPATVAINVTPDPKQVTIGTTTARSLTYTQPDGTIAKLTITGAVSAVVTFQNFDVQVTTSGTNLIASGPGATISDITVTTSSFHQRPVLSLTSKGGVPVIGGITSPASDFNRISAPTANLTGTINVAGVVTLTLGSATDANIIMSASIYTHLVSIGTATNTSITQTSPNGIIALKCNNWLDPEGGHSITSHFMNSLKVTGEFDESLTIDNGQFNGIVANIGHLGGGTWNISGLVNSINAKTVDPSWSLSTNNLVGSLKFGGDVSNQIAAGAILSLSVGGGLKNAVIETDAGWTSKFVQLGKIKANGSISNTQIIAQGNIGTITAASMTDSSILAGLDSTIIQSTNLPISHTDYVAPGARIQSVQLGSKGAFSNSRIAAGAIGSLRLGNVTTSNNSSPFGVAGATIGSISEVLDSTTKLNLGKAQLATEFALSSYLTEKNLTLNDFSMSLIP